MSKILNYQKYKYLKVEKNFISKKQIGSCYYRIFLKFEGGD